MKKVSINDIAKELGISKTTVSFVLNGRAEEKKISKKTQERIINLTKELGYRPSQVARSLSTGKSNTIGIVVPDIADPFYAKICRQIENIAHKEGYLVTFGSTDEDIAKEKELVDVLISRQTDGIILASADIHAPYIKTLLAQNYPLVLIDRVDRQVKADSVAVNNEEGSWQLVNHLINIGHKRIGVISLTSYLSTISQRIAGYEKAMRENGFAIDSSFIQEVDYLNKKQGVKKALGVLFNKGADAIYFLNNVLASEGVWNVNKYFSKEAEKVAFACFDDLDMFDYAEPKFISLAQPIDELANAAFILLNKRMVNKNASISEEVMATQMIVR